MQQLLPILRQNPQIPTTITLILVAIVSIMATITVINLIFKEIEDESKPYYFTVRIKTILFYSCFSINCPFWGVHFHGEQY